jgi:hypothetical protein
VSSQIVAKSERKAAHFVQRPRQLVARVNQLAQQFLLLLVRGSALRRNTQSCERMDLSISDDQKVTEKRASH